MLRNTILLSVLTAASIASAAQPAYAQATRTWVSGGGDDANPCSRTAPCKTFAGAISKTAAGGEINALDPAGYGAVTITKSITIDGGGGQVASTLVAGTNGIVVNPGAGHTVTLRNLRINGLAGTPTGGLNGIQVLSGDALHIENCTIFGFTQNGLNINVSTATTSSVFVTDTVISNSAGGIAVKNSGAGAVFLSAQRLTLTQNSGFGLKLDGSGGAAPIVGSVSDSLVAGNGTGLLAQGGPSTKVNLQVNRTQVVNNLTIGAQANGTGGGATIVFANTSITGNITGLSSVSGGTLLTYKSNALTANGSNGTFTNSFVAD